jgi:asparagine N-glycosylation enzyme membrane subunit Stt3
VSEQSPEQKRRLPPIVIVGIILAVLFGISLYIRIYLSYDQIFVNDWVWFRETDAYYHIRNIESLVHNFPHFNTFDPYMLYPGGGGGLTRPFFDWLVAAIVLLVSHGPPAQHTIETVGAYMPAILGTLTLIPVYFIGKELFNRWVGVISAALIVILPGEFLNRSRLGFTDHHVAEVLFSTVCILFLIMAIKRARERDISFGHLLSRDWSSITKPLVYTLLAGIFLGIYLLSWQGGLLFIFIIFVYLVIQFIVDHLRHKSSDYLCIIGTPLFLIAFLMLLPILGGRGLDTIYRVAMPVAIIGPIVLSIISRLIAGRAWKPVYYPLTLLGLAGIGLAAFHAINPSLLQSMLEKFSIFTPSGAMLTVLEVHPLTSWIAWYNFNTSFFFSFIALVMLIYPCVSEKGIDKILLIVWTIILLIAVVFGLPFALFICLAMLVYFAIKEEFAEKTLFLVWSVIMLIALLGQRRFGYYYAINIALLTGYFSWKMLDIAGLNKLLAKSKEVVGAVKKFRKKVKKSREKAKTGTFMQPRRAWVSVILVGIVIFFFVFFPNIGLWREEPTKIVQIGDQWLGIGYTRSLAEASPIMDEGWYSSLLWLKDNSPEPFSDPDLYYELYPPRDEFEYPETAYGVMSWWDYGYFITQISHRIPNCNPGGGYRKLVGRFFTVQNESSANELADRLDSKYVVIDSAMPITKFYAMVEWAGESVDDFYEVYYLPTEEGGQLIPLYYPAYYQSTVVRLYNFDGKAVTSTQPIVISYQEKEYGGEKYKEITSGQYFSSYEDAQAYVAAQTSGNYEIVGENPFISIVPLEELDSYELVYQSEATTTVAGQTLPSIKIFKHLGSAES